MPAQTAFIDTLGICVIAASLTVLIARWVRLPSIVSFIAAGLIIGPLGGLVGTGTAAPQAMALIGELGIALLMFVVGLELSFDRIRDVGKVALVAGIGQVVFTSVLGFGLCLLLGFDGLESLFIATALTFSSTAVVVKLLDQKKELHSLYGRMAVGIFLVQDLVVVIVLTILSGLGAPDSLTAGGLAVGLSRAFGGMLLLLAATVLGSRYLLPRALGSVAGNARTLFVWSIAWCLAFVLAAHALSLSAELGAFLAGIAIAQLPFAADLRHRAHPLMSFFVAIFFVSLGAGMRLSDASAFWLEGIVLSLFVLIGNPLIFIWIIARFGYSERTSFLTSVTVAQISEFSFVFAALGMSMGLIDQSILSVVSIVGVLTIAVSAYMILYNHGLYRVLRSWGVLRIFRARMAVDEEPAPARTEGHVLVVGMNDLGRRIATRLHERGAVVLAIDTDLRKLADLPCKTMVGDIDYASLLEEAGLTRARAAISALRIADANALFASRCNDAGVPVAIYTADRALREHLAVHGAAHLVDARREAGRRFAEELTGEASAS